MEITVSSRQSNAQLFCQIRKEFVKETPEERVRQSTLSSLFALGYPHSLILVEQKIADLPHLAIQTYKIPNRRVDILCYEGDSPYLLVECKAKSFSDKELRQLLGYNFYIGARYIALISQERLEVFSSDGGVIGNFLPSYFKK